MHIVIDTNVLISAALSPDGPPAKLLAKVLTDHCVMFTTATFAELESRLWKPKFDRYITLEERKAVLHDLSAAAVWVEVPQSIGEMAYSRDADDDMRAFYVNRLKTTLQATATQARERGLTQDKLDELLSDES